jgi:hypothetical protein
VILVEWSEFAVRFARELASLDRDTILIVREHDESRHYVQAMRETERLYAEAVSNNFLDGPLALTPADEEVLAEAGWRPPTPDWSPANWWTELPPAAPTGAHAGLADMMVTALRDVQGVRRPADLVYESFHRDGLGLIELVDFGIAPADPRRITAKRRTAEPVAAPTPPEPPAQPANQAAAQPAPPAQPPTPAPTPAPPRAAPPPYEPSKPESKLVEALRTADAGSCYEQFLAAELVLPATGQAVEDPSLAEFRTTVVDGDTRVLAFTSTQAMARAMGDRAVLHRKAAFRDLAASWPDPQWSLVINSGLPSEVRVDAVTVARLDEMRRTAEQAATVDALVTRSQTDDRRGAVAAPARPLPVPHGAQLWRLADVPSDAIPLAKYDAAANRWIAAESLPQVSP